MYQYRNDFTRNKHSQNMNYKWRPRKSGRARRRGCPEPHCVCTLGGKKMKRIPRWFINEYGAGGYFGWLLTRDGRFVEEEHRLVKNARKWRRIFARTRWIGRIKENF